MIYYLLLGLGNALFISTAVYALWLQNNFFSFRTTPLSHARKTHTKFQFTLYFIIGTLFEAAFIISLFYTFPVLQSTLVYILTCIGLGASIGIGITTNPKTRTIHQVCARLFMVTMILWSFIFHGLLFSVSPLHGILGFTLSGITLVGVPYFYFYKKSIGWTELFFIIIVLFWNVLLSSLIFRNLFL
jgi:hypothetical protein